MTDAITDLVSHLRRVKDAPVVLVAIKREIERHEAALRAVVSSSGPETMRIAAGSALACRDYIAEYLDEPTPPRAA